MAKLRIGREILKNALERAILSEPEKASVEKLMAAAAVKGPVNTDVTLNCRNRASRHYSMTPV